tara:strand:- start:1315 stop:2829 length:1515 start_codon:yes stop_codon:yes gene_type:complete
MKIVTLNNLTKICRKKKLSGKKIVHCHGVFDLLHIGHIKHFLEAKSFGDLLIVTITPDEYVNKGPNRPAFNTTLRVEAIAALQCVDYVAINKWPDATKTILEIKPNIYCKGPDYKESSKDLTGKIDEEDKAVNAIGGTLKFTNDITFSSSHLLNKFGYVYTDTQNKFVNKIKIKNNFDSIKQSIDKLKNLKVLVIGETIIDQYVFCEVLGKSGKESVLVSRDLETQKYLGGVLAIARHLHSFCNNISVLSFIGEKKEEEKFIYKNIEKNISINFLKKSNSSTIIKRRFIDSIDNKKMLGVYSINDNSLNKNEEKAFISKIDKMIKKYDLVIVSDYGHGIITGKVANHISKQKIYRSLNAQINSTNIGSHNIKKYKNIDSLIINASELRHEMREREGKLHNLSKQLKKDISAKLITVTQGRAGAFMVNQKNNLISCPSFNIDTIDKVGAGDALLALLSACLCSKIDETVSLLIASLAAAQSVETIGNSVPVDKSRLLKTLFHLMK